MMLNAKEYNRMIYDPLKQNAYVSDIPQVSNFNERTLL